MRIRFFCFWNALTGFGRAARDYVAALAHAGHEVEVVDWTSIPGSRSPPARTPERNYGAFDSLVRPWPARTDDGVVSIYHAQPRLLARLVETSTLPQGHDRLHAIALTTWETTQLPHAFGKGIEEGYLATITPSDYCAEVMGSLNHAVRVVPHTFKPSWWLPHANTRRMPTETLRFYAIGAWGERKNHQAILRAYLHAFEPEDRVSLTVWSSGADLVAVKSLLGRSGLAPDRIPELTVDHRPFPGVMDPHDRGDVFVSASRAEGWGLPCFEAAILGKTIISPMFSGETDYLDEYCGHRTVAHSLTPCFAGPGVPIAKGDMIVGEKTVAVPGMSCRELWAEPDVGELADRMRSCYLQHLEGNYFTGAPARALLESRFGYDVVAERFISTLQELLA